MWRWLDRLFALLFLLSALVQHNDPDPLPWMLAYGAAAAVCVVPATKRGGAGTAWLVSSLATAWAFWLAPEALELTELSALTASMSADQPEVEAAREALGLAIVSIYTAGVGLRDQWAGGNSDGPSPGPV